MEIGNWLLCWDGRTQALPATDVSDEKLLYSTVSDIDERGTPGLRQCIWIPVLRSYLYSF